MSDLIRLARAEMFMQYQNLRAARSMGMEASVRWASHREYISVEANSTYQSFRRTSTDENDEATRGDRIPNQPWLFANFVVRGKATELFFERDEVVLSGYLRYMHSFRRDWEGVGLQDFNVVIPSYLVPSIAATYEARFASTAWSLTLEVDNLSDADVRDYYGVQRPGRTYSAKLAIAL